jgi:hypothetical protein
MTRSAADVRAWRYGDDQENWAVQGTCPSFCPDPALLLPAAQCLDADSKELWAAWLGP